jgi:hypothetical protein
MFAKLILFNIFILTIWCQNIGIGVTVDPITLEKGLNVFEGNNSKSHIIPNYILTNETTIYTSIANYSYDGNVNVKFIEYNAFFAKKIYNREITSILQRMISKKTTYVQTELLIEIYKLTNLEINLSEAFTEFIDVLVSMIKENDGRGYLYWMSLFVDKIKYMTTSEVTMGGKLVQSQYINNYYYFNSDALTIKNAASASSFFHNFLSLNASSNEINNFLENSNLITTSYIGSPYEKGQTFNQWKENINSNPKVIGYYLIKTSQYIDQKYFPQYDSFLLNKIKIDYETIYEKYILSNSRIGCMNLFSYNLDLGATINDGCKFKYETGSSFGGLYFAESRNIPQYIERGNNPLTMNQSCPLGTFASCVTPSSDFFYGTLKITVSESLCVCMSYFEDLSQPSFGGFFGGGIRFPHTTAQFSGKHNLDNLVSSCPPLFKAHKIKIFSYFVDLCLPENLDNVGSFLFGGVFFELMGKCHPNPYTKECSCMKETPFRQHFSLSVQIQEPFSSLEYTNITLCWGKSQLERNQNPKNYISINTFFINGASIRNGSVIPFLPTTEEPFTSSKTPFYPTTDRPAKHSAAATVFSILVIIVIFTLICCIVSLFFFLFAIRNKHSRDGYHKLDQYDNL